MSAAEFDGWFESGAVSLNGVVKPADSVTFPNIPNCSFYKWSEQMFLWLTSPAPSRYGGGGGRIFNSPAFFDVSPANADGERTLVPHEAGFVRELKLRDAQVGPHGLRFVFDKAGRAFEVEPPVMAPSGRQMLLDMTGKRIEVHTARLGKDRRPTFLDQAGSVIKNARPILREGIRDARIAQRIMVDGGLSIFLGPAGNVIDVDQGQAGGGSVLMAQNHSLVYFITIVNDVFAYFLTGTKNGGITPAPTRFPTTQSELDKVLAFAAANGKTIVDPEALAIEVKSSWIEAAGLPDPSEFITIQATIPTYDETNPNEWVRNGMKTTTLALVGMHVVGSTRGHPEMLWATFEHVSSTPNAEYSYRNAGGTTTTVPQDTSGFWLFCSNGSTGPFNQAHMKVSGDNIVRIAPFTISPSDTIRWKAWGKAAPGSTSNAELISITNSVRSKLIAGDVRGNYIHTGTTWTIGGAEPNGANEVGTNKLCNTTMETYDQGSDNGPSGSNCFSCHFANTTSVSHVFPEIKPLF